MSDIWITATEYRRNALTLVDGTVGDIVSVGIALRSNPNDVPDPTGAGLGEFTAVALDPTGPDIVTLIGPRGGDIVPVAVGDYRSLHPGQDSRRRHHSAAVDPDGDGDSVSYAILEDGWVKVPYDGPELARVEIALGEVEPGEWRPAFVNTTTKGRFAQVRPTGMGMTQNYKIWMRVDGAPLLIGLLGDAPAVRPQRRRRG